MGMIAARHAREIVTNAEIVVALEALAAAQALDLRAPLRPARGDPRGARRDPRPVVPFFEVDRESRPGYRRDAVALVRAAALVEAAESAVRPARLTALARRQIIEPDEPPRSEPASV